MFGMSQHFTGLTMCAPSPSLRAVGPRTHLDPPYLDLCKTSKSSKRTHPTSDSNKIAKKQKQKQVKNVILQVTGFRLKVHNDAIPQIEV